MSIAKTVTKGLTKEQKRAKKANYYLLLSSLSEIQMELHSELKGISLYVQSTQDKFENLQVDFQRNSSKNHKMFIQDGGEESELLQFYRITNIIQAVFNKLMNNAHDYNKMPDLLGLMEKWEAGQLVFISSQEELKRLSEAGKEVLNG